MERNHAEYPGWPPTPPKKHSISCYVYSAARLQAIIAHSCKPVCIKRTLGLIAGLGERRARRGEDSGWCLQVYRYQILPGSDFLRLFQESSNGRTWFFLKAFSAGTGSGFPSNSVN